MNDNERNPGGFAGKKGYIALAMCLAAVGMIAFIALLTPGRITAKTPEKTDASVVQPDPEPAAPVTKPEPVEVPDPTPEPEPAPAPVLQPEPAEEPEPPEPEDLIPTVVSPLDGTTVTVFSMTELLYDETMADWRTHNGVDIQAGEGDAVKTAADGQVLAVGWDDMMGVTVVIEHAGGYTTQYSSLQEEPPVEPGQRVRAGEIIGYVGSTAAAESSMGPHLHFAVTRDGEIVDPREYVK